MAYPGVEMGQNDRQDEQQHDPLAHEERIARLLQEQPGVLCCLVARVSDDELPDQETPDYPYHASGEATEQYTSPVHAHVAPPK